MLEKRLRAPPAGATTVTELRLLREFFEYQGARQEKSSSTFEAPARTSRLAHVITLDDGEHLVLLMEDRRYCYWEGTRQPFERLRRRLSTWVTGSTSF
jgi:hypothetical protein